MGIGFIRLLLQLVTTTCCDYIWCGAVEITLVKSISYFIGCRVSLQTAEIKTTKWHFR